jgi:hypothetical protein
MHPIGLALEAEQPAFLLVTGHFSWAWLDLNQRPHPYQAHSRDAFMQLERGTTSSWVEKE